MAAGLATQSGTITPEGSATGNSPSARLSTPRLFKIDGSTHVADLERVLRTGGDDTRYMEALAILRRWQFDEMLDGASREKASALVWKFAPNGWDEV